MAEQKPRTVTVEALQAHSYNGKNYAVGDTYKINEQYAESVAIQGKAIRTDRAKVAKATAAPKVEAKAAKSPARATKNLRVGKRKG